MRKSGIEFRANESEFALDHTTVQPKRFAAKYQPNVSDSETGEGFPSAGSANETPCF